MSMMPAIVRAAVRARLAIMHVLDSDVRKPSQWRPQALDYLGWAFLPAEVLNG